MRQVDLFFRHIIGRLVKKLQIVEPYKRPAETDSLHIVACTARKCQFHADQVAESAVQLARVFQPGILGEINLCRGIVAERCCPSGIIAIAVEMLCDIIIQLLSRLHQFRICRSAGILDKISRPLVSVGCRSLIISIIYLRIRTIAQFKVMFHDLGCVLLKLAQVTWMRLYLRLGSRLYHHVVDLQPCRYIPYRRLDRFFHMRLCVVHIALHPLPVPEYIDLIELCRLEHPVQLIDTLADFLLYDMPVVF